MARILVNKEWYEQVEPSTFSEIELEDRVILHAPSVYPEYHVLSFKQTVQSEFGRAKADLVFIAKDYREWRVVEVEMGYHSLASHVEPQVQILAAAEFGKAESEYLYRKYPFLEYDAILTLLERIPPQVLIIVNEPKPDWIKPLSKYGAIVATFELFRSEHEIEIFRVDGEYPAQIADVVSQCCFHPITARFLEIQNAHALALPPRGRIKLRYNNCMTEWERTDAEGKVWLSPIGRNPLNAEYLYEIFRQSDNTLILRRRSS